MSSVLGFLVLVAMATCLPPANAGFWNWWRSTKGVGSYAGGLSATMETTSGSSCKTCGGSCGWTEEAPANCPYQNNETHVCSTLETSGGICVKVDCCENFEDGEEVDEVDESDDSESSEESDDSESSDEMGHHGGHHGENCRLCASIRYCNLFKCYSSCCDGYERDHSGRCSNKTGELQCENGGELRRSWWSGSLYCKCPHGFRGHNCEKPVCRCKNGGECVVKDGQPHCNCVYGYYGDRCEKSNCTTECYNGGKCYTYDNKEFCWCPDNFIGRQCKKYYSNPDTCPTPEHVSDMCECECTSNSDCDENHVCCKEGCSSICRKLKPEYCEYDGQRYDINATYSPDPCTSCYCPDTGEMMCAVVSCAYPQCLYGEPTVVPGQCCPSCPEKPDPPKMQNCPTSALCVNTTSDSDQAQLDEKSTKIEAYDSEGNTLQVNFKPEKVHHCHCTPSVSSQTPVQAYVTDKYDSMATCSFNVVVKDVYPPRFTYCPNNISVSENENVQWKQPTYEDNVGIARVTVPERISGDVFPVGHHVMTYIVWDHDGNIASCNFTVTVAREPPRIDNCHADVLYVDTTYYTNYAVMNELTTGISAFDPENNKLQVQYEPQTVEHCACPYPMNEESTVRAMAKDDHGKNVTCTFRVIVKDIYLPKFTYCPGDVEVSEGETVTWKEPTYTDNVGLGEIKRDTRNGDVFPVGKTTITYKIWDYEQNEASCQFNVHVEETKPEPPRIENCPTDVLRVNTSRYSDHTELDDRKTGIRAYDADGNQLQVTYQPEKVQHCHCYDPASNQVNVQTSVTDSNGNTDTCQFKVVVKDIYKPVFTYCPNNKYVSENDRVIWQEPTYSDNVAVVDTSVPTFRNGQMFPVGNHTVIYEIWDSEYNSAFCVFNVSVTKEVPKPPKIVNCPTKVLEMNTTSNSDQTVLSKELTSIQAFDHEGSKLQITYEPEIVRHCHCHDVHTTETTVYASVTDDEGVRETCTFNITVTDKYDPVIYNCPQNIQVSEGETVEWIEPTFSDNVGIAGKDVSRQSGDTFSVGRHTVSYTVWDYDSNYASCSFDVTVTKRVPPKIHNCSNNVLVLNTPPTADYVKLNENTTSMAAYDAEGKKLQMTFSPSSVRHCHCYNSATNETLVEASAQDHHGNIVTCSFRVVVIDQVRPVITYCPPQNNFVSEDEVVRWRNVDVYDNVQVARRSVTGRTPGSTFPVGVHEIEYEFWDYDGNSARSCKFKVTVSRAKCTLECFNGGWCHRNGNNQFCRCPPDYVGIQCEQKYIHTHCQHEGKQYSVSDTYSPDPCSTCTCFNTGEMVCSTVKCAKPNCAGGRQPVSTPGRCCLECPEEPKPRIICPSHTVHVNTTYYTDKAMLANTTTFVEAYDSSNQQLQVHYRPPHVYHCNCNNPLGHETTVQAYANDIHGSVATCSFKVVVRDIYPPKVTSCPEDVFVYERQVVRWMQPSSVDNVGVAGKSCSSRKNGKVFPVGEHRISCDIWDYDRNTASCHFRVFVAKEDTPVEDLPLGYREKSTEGDKLHIIMPPIFGAIFLAALVALLLYFCRRKCEPDFFMKKSPKPVKEENIYAEPGDIDPKISSKPKRSSMSTYSSASSRSVSSRALSFRSNVYAVPGDVGVRPPPYSPHSYNPPPYSISGSVRDVTYMSLPLPSYPNPEYETVGVHRSSAYSPSVMSGSTVASRPRSKKSSRHSTTGSVKSSKSSKSSYRA